MGIDIYLDCWVHYEERDEAFFQMALRLLEIACNEEALFQGQSVSREQIPSLLRHAIDHQEFQGRLGRIGAAFSYKPRFGQPLWLEVSLEKEWAGWGPGPPRCFCASLGSDALRPFPDDEPGFLQTQWTKEQGWQTDELWYRTWAVTSNIEELLLQIVRTDQDSIPIRHVSVQWDDKLWNVPLHARMVYHTDVTDFAKDFLRTKFWWLYDVSDYGASFAASPSLAIDEAIAKGLMDSDQQIADFLKENPSISHLMDRGRAEKWAEADALTVERAIHDAAGLVADVSVKRVMDAGWVVGTHIYNGLQEFYLALARLLDDEAARAPR